MAGNAPDEAFARAAQQAGMVTFDELEAARAAQAESAKKGVTTPLADVLVKQGVINSAIREKIEKKAQAEESGGAGQLGPYKLLKKLGEGGMGAVYLAEDTMAGRKVAVKVLPKKYSDEREFLTRFRREAQATGKLNHPNIVVAYNVGEESGTHYYAMEYCEGDTLDRILKREQYLPWDKALEVTIQVARGLKHAHDHGVIHRDIKPANIFICSPGSAGVPPASADAGGTPALPDGFTAKILDLGLSKNISSSNEQSYLTQTGTALGTPHYISPEQARGDKGIDGRTDIYSLGATLYHLVTGQTPFSGTTAGVIIAKHLSEQLSNPQDIRDEIPDGIVQIIQKMMAKEAADRYANCGELLVDLELASQGKQPSGVNLDPALTTVALRRKGAQAKGAGRPRAAQPGAAVVRKRTEPVPLEPLDATLLRKDAARGKSEPRPSGSGPLADARGSEGARGHTRLGRKQYIAAGVAGLGLLVLIAALAMKGTSETPSSKSETSANTETAKPDSGTAKVEPVVANAESLPKELSLDLGGGVKMDMVLVPAGDFMMGEKGLAEPVHAVKISKPFYMGKYVVTQEQYQAVIGKNPSGFNGQKNPVENVSWLDAQEFCKKVSQKTGKSVCLPTEAEWEYACRAGTTTKFNTGDKDSDLEQAAWFNKNSVGHMNAVGQKKPNAWGLYDMHGNAWEWVQDYFSDKYYADSPPVDPKGPANGVERVLRGGCWFNNPGGCLAAHRIRYVPDHLGSDVGFRCVLDLAGGGAPVAVQPETPSPKPEPAALPKETALDLGGGVKMDMVLVPAGDFMMGSNDGPPEEKPAHKVKLSKPFYMGKYVVTQEQYEAVIGTNPANFKGPKNPVEQVSWLDAQEFCKKLGQKTGKTVRLPTEAEWEYACRSGTTTRYNTGDKDSDLEQAAWFNKNSGGHTNAVGQKKPDAWGLYDMHGNVWEWCADWFNDKYYQESPPVDPKGPASGRDRVLRGGSWNYYPDQCRAARRGGRTPGNRFADLGFRLALDF